jgi:hypothetical protein
MKVKGRRIQGPNVEPIIIPRHDGDIELMAQAVLDMTDFDNAVPMPKAPKITMAGGAIKEDVDDPGYKALMTQRGQQRYGYFMMKSLSVTEGLEWDILDSEKPETWSKWDEELKLAGFSNAEVNMIMAGIASANGINAEKLAEARARFLASRTQPVSASSLTAGPKSTQSGEPVSV